MDVINDSVVNKIVQKNLLMLIYFRMIYPTVKYSVI